MMWTGRGWREVASLFGRVLARPAGRVAALQTLGAGSLVVGAAMIYPPAGWITAGVALVLGAFLAEPEQR